MVLAPDCTAAYVGWSVIPKIGAEIDEYNRSTDGTLTFANSLLAPLDPSNGFAKTISSLAGDSQGKYVAATWDANPPCGPTPPCGLQGLVADEVDLYRIQNDKTLQQTAALILPFNLSPVPVNLPHAKHMLFDSTGGWLAAATGTGIAMYQVDRAKGTLTAGAPVDSSIAFDHLAFSSSGQYLLAVSSTTNAIYVYNFQPQTGALIPASGSPYARS
jgi:hypothetical protein